MNSVGGRARRYAPLCVALIILFLCWGSAEYNAQWLAREYRGVSVRMQDDGIDGDTLKSALAKATHQPARVTAWNRSSDKLTLANAALNTTAPVRRLAVLGDMAEVCPVRVLYGALPVTDDKLGCAIDEASAQRLFRNADVVGAALKVDNTDYIVRAVVSSLEPVLMVRDADARYQNIELEYDDFESCKANAQELMRGLSEEYVLVESGFWGRLAANAAVLPSIVAFVAVLLLPLCAAWRRRGIPLQLVLLLAGAIGLFAALKWLFGLAVYFPERCLPTRWSDFDFWQRLAEDARVYFQSLSFLTPAPKELEWSAAARSLVACSFVACVAMAWVLYLLRKESGFMLVRLILTVLCCVLATGILHLTDVAFKPSGGYLLAVPVWWAAVNCKSAMRGMAKETTVCEKMY